MISEATRGRRLYVGFSLTWASREFSAKVENLKAVLRQKGYHVLDFFDPVGGTPREVYEWDIGHCVSSCDVFLAICDEASTGLGWELAEAVKLRKPTLAVAHVNSKVTRLVLGAADTESNLQFEVYEDLVKDIPPVVDKTFADLRRATREAGLPR
jgi:nucleoside 2-deoxyribosyltransferase